MKSRPSLSVVIITHNEKDDLGRTVEAMLATLPSNGEIVVVDDQSTDGSTAFLEGGDIPLVRPSQRLGISAARNLGARNTTGEVIVFSDAHVQPEPGWSEAIYLAAIKPFVGAVAPAISLFDNRATKGYGFTWRDASLKMHWLPLRGVAPYPVPFLCGCFVAMRREVFKIEA